MLVGFNVAVPLTFSLIVCDKAYITYYYVTNHLQHYKRYSTGVRRLRHPFKGSVMSTSSKLLALLTVTHLRTDFAALLLSACQPSPYLYIYLSQTKENPKKSIDFDSVD